jgi:DUF1680 family protein
MAKTSTTSKQENDTLNIHLTTAEIKKIVENGKSGLRYTVDLYLLDYLKHCLLEDGQLGSNIDKLNAAIEHIGNPEIKKGLEDVIENLNCVQKEYTEYVKDMRTLISGGVPDAR